ncbi:helix-turn-helix domain-containing protein [Nocardia sp. NPDC050717]|uniref:helix-turn-helix domain-containing protein n=1 Tax=Nocardia sp. NPDC050717 TaxID=3157221 RepID=UPI00340F1ACE
MPSHHTSSDTSSNRGDIPERPPQPNDETWLSTAELAARLKIPVKTLANWAASGAGPRFARMGRHRTVPLESNP